jgi:SAM-dependent methyltransferase
VSPAFLALLDGEALKDRVVLDVGCGAGRLALALAPRCGRVIGIDRDADALVEARARARAARLGNVEFRLADAETVEYDGFAPRMVVAHLCMSDAIIERAARALGPGEALAFVCFHVDQWRETGRVSRFAYDETRLRGVLEGQGFLVEHLEAEREVRRFESSEAALAHVTTLGAKWERDGRWERYLAFVNSGGRTLTRSHLIVKTRRR